MYQKQWYNYYSGKYQFVPRFVAQIPWGQTRTTFQQTLPAAQSKLATETLQVPYNDALEKAIEDDLVINITKFLLELGKGFAILGRQYIIEISGPHRVAVQKATLSIRLSTTLI